MRLFAFIGVALIAVVASSAAQVSTVAVAAGGSTLNRPEDPVVLTHSWTARFPLKLDPDYKLLEYTCHEDNRVIGDWISVSRAERSGKGATNIEAPTTRR